jgi:hypothetical protein
MDVELRMLRVDVHISQLLKVESAVRHVFGGCKR